MEAVKFDDVAERASKFHLVQDGNPKTASLVEVNMLIKGTLQGMNSICGALLRESFWGNEYLLSKLANGLAGMLELLHYALEDREKLLADICGDKLKEEGIKPFDFGKFYFF